MIDSEQSAVWAGFQYKGPKSQNGKGGFLCLWPDQVTFVPSNFVRWVLPIPLIGRLLPLKPPRSPEDPRPSIRVPLAGLAEITSPSRGGKSLVYGQKVRISSRDGQEYFFGGGNINGDLTFETVSGAAQRLLEAAGYQVMLTEDALRTA